MTNTPPTPMHDASDQELLLSRAVDGTLTDEQWASLEAKAAQHPALWRELCLLHRDDLAVRARVVDAARAASLDASLDADAPSDLATHGHAMHIAHASTHAPSARAWMGWAAAAVFGIVAAVSMSQRSGTMINTQASPSTQAAGLGGFLSVDDALEAATPEQLLSRYVQSGREQGSVYGVIPERVMLQSTPLEDGRGYEVYYVRQIIERAHVPGFYFVGVDELGNPAPVPTSPLPTRSPSAHPTLRAVPGAL